MINESFQGEKLDFGTVEFVPDLLLKHAHAQPNKTAVVCDEKRLSYSRFAEEVFLLAKILRDKYGVRRGITVAQCAERSIEMVVGMLAIMYAGGVYCPLLPGEAVQRFKYLLDITKAPVLLTTRDILPSLEAAGVFYPPLSHPTLKGVILLDETVLCDLARQSTTVPTSIHDCEPSDLLYMVHTSGSTGLPKSVCIPHCAFFNLMRGYFMTQDDVILQTASCSFDPHLQQIAGTIMVGATVVMLHKNGMFDMEYLTCMAELNKCTLSLLVPSQVPLLSKFLDEAKAWSRLSSLRNIELGGEALPPSCLALLRIRLPLVQFYNVYGPAETTVWTTTHRCSHEDEKLSSVPIGRPLPNYSCHVLDHQDDRLEELPIGAVGMLYIGGPSLFHGYLARPDLTAQATVLHPTFGRLYKSGDLARWRPDGTLLYCGREDFQVKLNGQRLELGEIEATIQKTPSVTGVLVMKREDGGQPYLAAYITRDFPGSLDPSPEPLDEREADAAVIAAAKRMCQDSLPAYMVPSAWCVLERFPLNASGKTDRKQLPCPRRPGPSDLTAPAAPSDPAALALGLDGRLVPRGEREGWLQAFVEGHLQSIGGLSREALGDASLDLISLGISSLKLMAVVNAIARGCASFGVFVAAASLIALPSVHSIVAHLCSVLASLDATAADAGAVMVGGAIGTGGPEGASTVTSPKSEPSLDSEDVGVASPAELFFWNLSEESLPAHKGVYNEPVAFEMSGTLDIARLQAALAAVVMRHACLRACFQWNKDVLLRRILPEVPVAILLEQVEVGQLSRRLRELASMALDLTKGPLFRCTVLQMQATHNVLLLVVHHIILDPTSQSLLLRDLASHYNALEACPLPTLKASYSHFALWYNRWVASQECSSQIQYWNRCVAGVTDLVFPMDQARTRPVSGPVAQPEPRAQLRVSLPACDLAAFELWCQQQRVTLVSGLLAIYSIILARYANQVDLTIGTMVDLRSNVAGMEDVVGLFVNPVVLRMRCLVADDLAARSKIAWLALKEAIINAAVPISRVLKETDLARLASPLQPFFGFQRQFPLPSLNGIVASPSEDLIPDTFNLSLFATRLLQGGLELVFKYSLDAVDNRTVEAFAQQFRQMFSGSTATGTVSPTEG